jgi:hypothetical protein
LGVFPSLVTPAAGNASATALFLPTAIGGDVWNLTPGVYQYSSTHTYVAGLTYTLQMDVIHVDSSTGDGNLGFQMGSSTDIPGTFPALNDAQAITDSNPWTTYSRSFVAGAGLAGQPIAIRVFNVGHRNLQIDNVIVTPEPATMSMVGLGALALLRRRRKA